MSAFNLEDDPFEVKRQEIDAVRTLAAAVDPSMHDYANAGLTDEDMQRITEREAADSLKAEKARNIHVVGVVSLESHDYTIGRDRETKAFSFAAGDYAHTPGQVRDEIQWNSAAPTYSQALHEARGHAVDAHSADREDTRLSVDDMQPVPEARTDQQEKYGYDVWQHRETGQYHFSLDRNNEAGEMQFSRGYQEKESADLGAVISCEARDAHDKQVDNWLAERAQKIEHLEEGLKPYNEPEPQTRGFEMVDEQEQQRARRG